MADKPKLHMIISLEVYRVDDDLADPCYADERVELYVPYMEPKQLDLSKVLQGATEAVINRHRDVVSKALRERDEKKKREQAPMLWVTGEVVANEEK